MAVRAIADQAFYLCFNTSKMTFLEDFHEIHWQGQFQLMDHYDIIPRKQPRLDTLKNRIIFAYHDFNPKGYCFELGLTTSILNTQLLMETLVN